MVYKTELSIQTDVNNKDWIISTHIKSNVVTYEKVGKKIFIFKASINDVPQNKNELISHTTYIIRGWLDNVSKGGLDTPDDILEINNIVSNPIIIIDATQKVITTTLTGEIPIYIYTAIDRAIVSNKREHIKSVLLSPATIFGISKVGVIHNKNLLLDLYRTHGTSIRNMEFLSVQLINILKSRLEYIENKSQHPIYISFSGGIDSSLLLKIAYENGLNIVPITIGLRKSKDIQSVKQSLRELRYEGDNNLIEISERNVLESMYELQNCIKTRNLVHLSIACVENLIMKNLRGKILVMGQGADELYGGYDKYRRLYNRYPEENLIDLALLYKGTTLIEYELSELNDVIITYPYLTYLGFLHAKTVPNIFKVSGRDDRLRKWVIRTALKRLGTPKEIYMRRKRAMQYSTGIDKVIKTILSKKEAKY